MKGHSHTITISKSALTGLWVITVLLLECFVFRFACSVSKANNHSLFTVWVGLFFPSAGQITHKSDSSQRKTGPTVSPGSGKCSLKSRGKGRWLQPCSLLTLWQGQQRVGDMDILYSYNGHYNKLPSIAAIKSAWYTILRYLSNTLYLKKNVEPTHWRSFWSKHTGGCPYSKIESLLRRVYLCVFPKTSSPSGFHWHHTRRLAQTTRHTNTRRSNCMASLGYASPLEGFMMANRG